MEKQDRWERFSKTVFSFINPDYPPPSETPKSNPMAKTRQTGDKVIDDAEKHFTRLKSGRDSISESRLIETLAPLFSRPTFYYGIREENWNYFLFIVCKTRLILQEYIKDLKSSPNIRTELGRSVELMVRLQNDVSTSYGFTKKVQRGWMTRY